MSVGLCKVEVRQQGVVEREVEMSEVSQAVCPNCENKITESNPMVAEYYVEGGVCQDCYDPTPAGPEYSAGFEMNH